MTRNRWRVSCGSHAVVLLAAAWVLLGPASTAGAGIRLTPGAFCVQGVAVGERVDVEKLGGVVLTVENTGDTEETFKLEAGVPSRMGAKPVTGYSDIPDASWFKLDPDTVKVPAHGSAKVRMVIKVPAGDQYANRHWLVAVSVVPTSSAFVQVKLLARFQIETVSKESPAKTPPGVSAAPSRVFMKRITPGLKDSGRFVVFNNGATEETLTLVPFAVPQASEKQDIAPTPGHERLKELGWVKLSTERLTLKPGQKGEVSVSVNVPGDVKPSDLPYEVLVGIERKDAPLEFVRVTFDN